MTHPPDLAAALQHERALRRLACMLHLGGADADDAVQHALTQAALGKRPPGMPLGTFLRITLKRHAWNLRKLAGRRRAREGAAAGDPTVMPVDEMLARDQLRRRVAEAVIALQEPYRSTVWLRWFEGLTVDEIAARMAAPPNTVRTRLQRGHALLRTRLDRDYGDGRWGALAWPVGALAGTGAQVAGIGVAAAALVLCLVTALWSWSPAAVEPEPVTPRPTEVAADTPAEQAPLATAPNASPTQRSELVVAPSPEFLQVVHPGGRELADAPVWWWNEADRPEWTQVAARKGGFHPFAEGDEPASPGQPAAQTDASGRVLVPTPRPVAVTIGLDANTWLSADLTRLRLELPVFVELEATVRRAPREAEWEARFAVVRDDEPGEWDVASDLLVDLLTGTGPVALRLVAPRTRAAATDPISLRVPAEPKCQWTVVAAGHGFVIDKAPPPRRAPAEFVLTAGRPVPRHVVTVMAPGGLVTDVPGFARVQRRDGGWDALPLDGGRAIFDSADYGKAPSISVCMVDGERADATPLVGKSPTERAWVVKLRGVRDAQHVFAPSLQPRDVHCVFVEDGGGHWVKAPRLEREAANGPEHGFDGHGLWIAGLPVQAGRRVCVVTRTGRVAMGTFDWLGNAPAEWMPALPPVDIVVARYYRECGSGMPLRAAVEFGLPTADGSLSWHAVASHRQRDGGPPPVWARRELPLTMPWRLRVLDEQPGTPRELLVRTTLP